MNKIKSNKELKHGEYYWLCSKMVYDNVKKSNMKMIKRFINDLYSKPHFDGRMWAYDENNQALENYDIYGPIPKPEDVEVYKLTSFNVSGITDKDRKIIINQPPTYITFDIIVDKKGK